MTPDCILEIKEARNKITPGVWFVDEDGDVSSSCLDAYGRNGTVANVWEADDAIFFANAPTYIDELLSEREEMVDYLRRLWYGDDDMSQYGDHIVELLGGK